MLRTHIKILQLKENAPSCIVMNKKEGASCITTQVHAHAFVESEGGWLNNPGFHGLGERLYEFTL